MKSQNNKCVYKGKIAFFYRGSWYHRKKELLENGKTKYGKLGGFKTPEEAEESYFKCLKKYEEQRRNYIAPIINKEILLKDYIIYWFEKVFKTKTESTTAMVTSYVVYNLIIPNLPYEIKTRLVTTDFINKTLESIDKLGKTTANKSREVFSLIFKNVVYDGILNVNPVETAKLYRRGKTNIVILTKEEIKKFLTVTCNSETWYLEILLALFCGLRKGEIRGLKFTDFNYKNRTVKISRQLANKYELDVNNFKVKKLTFVEKDPKTENSFRTLRVPDIIWEELDRRKNVVELNKTKYQDDYIDNGYISCQENGIPHSATGLNSYITKQCKINGIRKITVHGLRHLYATILIEQGVPIHKISALLGHSSIHTTFDIYLDIICEKEKIIAFMNNTFVMEESEE